jgi:hypothetical protein
MSLPPRPRWSSRIFLALWATAMVVPISFLMAGHLLTLPAPEKAALQPRLHADTTASNQWRTFHVLGSGCKCSSNVLKHLLERKAQPGVAETILYVGAETPQLAETRTAGFEVEALDPRQLADKYNIQTVPLFIVVDPSQRVVYSGGYTDRKQGPDIKDLTLLEGLMAGKAEHELPLFGCAVSRELQQQLDPLGLKYAAKGNQP